MLRTNIYITERQQTALKVEADSLGLSVAEVVRRVLDQHIEGRDEETKTKSK